MPNKTSKLEERKKTFQELEVEFQAKQKEDFLRNQQLKNKQGK